MKNSEAFTSRPPKKSPQPAAANPISRLTLGLIVAGILLVAGGLMYHYRGVLWRDIKLPEITDEFDDDDKERLPPKLNPTTPPGPAPAGMVWIPGGEFYMGIDPDKHENALPRNQPFGDTQPLHKVYVDGFWLDTHEVTNDEFARFVAATNYVTTAEKKPDPKDFPDVPASELEPFSIVFKQPGPNDAVDMRNHLGWWDVGKGASWKHPEGPKSTIKGREKHPAVHICYDDAVAYCAWAKKRLPTEAEWEFAARGGLDRNLYSWGDEFTPSKKWMCNTWQGQFPYVDEKLDGFHGTAPVGSFPPNGYGLYDMAGNVWEWCSDYYQVGYYRKSPLENPTGPVSGFDPAEPGTPKRVQRGGSFLCAPNYCARYIMGTRGKGEPSSAQSHVGFRCVRDAK